MAPQTRLASMLAALALLLGLCVPAQTALSTSGHGDTVLRNVAAEHVTLTGSELGPKLRLGEPQRAGKPLTPAVLAAVLIAALARGRWRGRRRAGIRRPDLRPSARGSRAPPRTTSPA